MGGLTGETSPPSPRPGVRLFVAVHPPAAAVPGVRNPHVTLCFLGTVDVDLVGEVADALQLGLEGVRAVEAEVTGGRPRRLGPSAFVRPVTGLDGLAGAVRGAVGRFATRPEERPFRGHLTVARRAKGRPSAGLEGEVPAEAVRWKVDEVVLVRSELGRGPGGTVRHEVVVAVPLEGN